MKNRKLLLIVSLVLALTMSLGGTLAYLQDTDEAVNVMTLGNVQIEQIELQRAEGVAHNATATEGSLVTFKQGQGLYPAFPVNGNKTDYEAAKEQADGFKWGPYVTADVAAGSTAWNGLFNDNNLRGVMDKFVFVKNTGSSPAYYRTWLAFECPESLNYTMGEVSDTNKPDLRVNTNSNTLFSWGGGDSDVFFEIDDVRYLVMCATYSNALQPGEISRPSLLQVALTHYADNADMEALGGTYEILAFTQAVQTENFTDAKQALTAAFGAAETADDFKKNHPWKDADGNDHVNGLPSVGVSNTAELEKAIEAGNATIYLLSGDYKLTKNLEAKTALHIGSDAKVTLDLNGKTLTATTTAIENNGTVTITGGTVKNTKTNGSAVIKNNGTMVLDDVAIEGAPIGDTGYPAYAVVGAGKLTVEEGTSITSDRGAISMSNGAEVIINGGDIKLNDTISTRALTAHVIYAYGYNSKLTINGGAFVNNCQFSSDKGASVICPAGATINVYGGSFTFTGVNGQNGIFQNYMGYGAPVKVYGGTYNDTTFNQNLADGYQANANGDGTWTVAAAN